MFAGAATAVLLIALLLSRSDGQLHVWLLDVGHSNAVLLQTPGGAHVLVDGGRFPARLLTAIGDRLPFNKQTLDVLIVTQPDENQIGALPTVLSRYDVGVVLMHGQENLSPAYTALLDSLAGRVVVDVVAGYTVDIDDGTRLEVLHPQAQPALEDSLDDNALVLRVRYGAVSFLLTSDLSADGQVMLMDAGQYPLATVLQLPQHGTARSLDLDFLQAVQPQVVMLQSDPTNRRRDPDPDTLALLGDVRLFRTDERGTLHLWTDGRDLWVE